MALTLPPNPGIYHDTTPCELVLEDNPVGEDSSLEFESFPGEVEETYALNEYREMGGDRMPQPSFVAYRGGNWNPFTLQLIFRAGRRQGDQIAQQAGLRTTPLALTDAELQQILIRMERKVRWCQALGFPLERALGETTVRQITSSARANQFAAAQGIPPSQSTTEKLSSLRRNDPPIVLIVFGSWWVQRAYAKNVSVKWTGPWHPISVRPYGAEVTITFQPIKAVYPTWQLIRDQAGQYGYDVDPGNNPLVRGFVDSSRQRDTNRAAGNAGAV